VEILANLLTGVLAIWLVESLENPVQLPLEFGGVVFQNGALVEEHQKDVSVTLALKKVDQVLFVERLVSGILFLDGIEIAAEFHIVHLGQLSEIKLIKLLCGEVFGILNFLHDEFKNEFHVFLISFH
jgi:hypothetical protein